MIFSNFKQTLFLLVICGMTRASYDIDPNLAAPGLTAAQKLAGYSGSYGTGGGIGGITLNDIAYDLSPSFTQACQQVGIKLGLPVVPTAHISQYDPLIPIGSGIESGLPIGSGIESGLPIGFKNLNLQVTPLVVDNVPLEKPVIHSIAPDLDTLSTSGFGSSGYKSANIEVIPTNGYSNEYHNQYNNGYKFISHSIGDRLTSKLTSHLPFSTHKYNIRNSYGKSVASGYSSHIIHSSKHGGGESSVHFHQMHPGNSKVVSVPHLSESAIDQEYLINDYRPFSYEYPTEYKSALTKRSSYVSEINGGFGSMLTGSYGSVLNNGYKSVHMLSNGGLKGLKFLSTKK